MDTSRHKWAHQPEYDTYIEWAIAHFIERGGKIKIIPAGKSGNVDYNGVNSKATTEEDPTRFLVKNITNPHYLPPMTPQEAWMYKNMRKKGFTREKALHEVLK